jgi:MoxR-like ATPase
MAGEKPAPPQAVVSPEVLLHARSIVNQIYVDERIKDYVLNIIFTTRDPAENNLRKLAQFIEFGVSPRGTIFLIRAAKANAFLNGRGYVTPDDVRLIAADVLRHRLSLSFEAQAESITSDQIIQQIIKRVEVP